LRKKVKDYENYIKRLKHYVDQEKTDTVIRELEKTQVSEIDLDQLIDEISKVQEEVKDAQAFRFI
jgi:hypothetical protein